MQSPVAVGIDNSAIAGVGNDLLCIEHPAGAEVHTGVSSVCAKHGVAVLTAGVGGVIYMVYSNGINRACRAHIVLDERELAAVVANITCSGSVNAVGLVGVVAFKTGAVSVFHYEERSCISVRGIAAAEGCVSHTGVVH